MNKKAPRTNKVCVGCGQIFEVRLSQVKRQMSCLKPECIRKAYSLASSNKSVAVRRKMGKTRHEKFLKGEIKSRIMEFRYSGNELTKAESLIASYLYEKGFTSHFQINTGATARYGESPMFIVDFGNPQNKLYIEIDGRNHKTLSYKITDQKRDQCLGTMGWQGIRIANETIFSDLEKAKQIIGKFLTYPQLENPHFPSVSQ